MNKKFKYTSLVAAGAVTLGLVGGTLAWFTAQDSVVNPFATGTVTDEDGDNDGANAGIEIVEDFDEEGAKKILPGTTVNKDVQVQSYANYAQFVKVKLTPQFVQEKDDERVPYTADELKELGITNDMIKLNVTSHVVDLSNDQTLPELNEGTWYLINGEYYYYGKLAPQGTKDNKETLIDYTNTLLDSVTLKSEADNNYKNKVFDVKVEAYSIQASNGAASDEWFKGATGVLLELKTKFEELESKGGYTAPEDSKEVYESEDTNGSHIHKAPSSSTK